MSTLGDDEIVTRGGAELSDETRAEMDVDADDADDMDTADDADSDSADTTDDADTVDPDTGPADSGG
ncbi:MAG: hypothetical protein ICV71_07020 [Thermoleophilia bacterium]|nr:hypothetical protein [Thermoleophilia bacterium]